MEKILNVMTTKILEGINALALKEGCEMKRAAAALEKLFSL